MVEAYEEYYEAAREAMRAGATAHDVHRAVSKGFTERGYHLGHVTGHSIGMTMIEFPKIGEGVETSCARAWSSRCTRTRSPRTGKACLYMQDTWLVTADGGEPLSGLPSRIFQDAGVAEVPRPSVRLGSRIECARRCPVKPPFPAVPVDREIHVRHERRGRSGRPRDSPCFRRAAGGCCEDVEHRVDVLGVL